MLEALKERQTLAQLAKTYSLHPQQITDWKKQAMGGLPEVFGKESAVVPPDLEVLTAPLYQKIGKLEVELDFLRRTQKKFRAYRFGCAPPAA